MIARPITQQISLRADTARALLVPAVRRGLTVGELATRIVEITVHEGMIAAVMDDGIRDSGASDEEGVDAT